jgi:hypothetical protein
MARSDATTIRRLLNIVRFSFQEPDARVALPCSPSSTSDRMNRHLLLKNFSRNPDSQAFFAGFA